MKNTVKIAFAAMMIAAFAFTGCKKGDGDPAISLLTRKMRITGDWKVTKGEGTETNGSITTTISYDGTTETRKTGSVSVTNKYTDEYNIEKDGSFKYIHTDNNNSPADVTTYTGTWNWTGGVGDAKKKAQVVFTVTSIADASGTSSYTGTQCPVMIYDIYELKNKEMIFYDKGTDANYTSDTKWTLAQ